MSDMNCLCAKPGETAPDCKIHEQPASQHTFGKDLRRAADDLDMLEERDPAIGRVGLANRLRAMSVHLNRWCVSHSSTWHSAGQYCDRGYAIALLTAGLVGDDRHEPHPSIVDCELLGGGV